MDPLLVVSPHLDDAVLSVGQLIAGHSNPVVVTVYAGTPRRNRQLTTYDQGCGFSSAADAMRSRRREDLSALGILGARAEHLRFVDGQYDQDEPASDLVAAELSRLVDEIRPHAVVGPVGIAHPDHLATADAFRVLLDARPEVVAWVYEELPARVLWPDQAIARLDRWRDVGFEPVLDFAGTGPMHEKRAALDVYASQHEALRAVCGGNLYPALVPERLHRLERITKPCV